MDRTRTRIFTIFAGLLLAVFLSAPSNATDITKRHEWIQAVRSHLASNLVLRPDDIEQRRQARLTMLVSSDGTIVEANLSESSGDENFDRAVRRMAQRASPLPPFTPDMGDRPIELSVPVDASE